MNVIKSLRRQWQIRKAISELNTMPNYLLADLGIERQNIPAVVKGLMTETATPALVNRVAKAGNIVIHSA